MRMIMPSLMSGGWELSPLFLPVTATRLTTRHSIAKKLRMNRPFKRFGNFVPQFP